MLIGIICVVIQTCYAGGLQGFSCLPGHIIKIHSAKVGIISEQNSQISLKSFQPRPNWHCFLREPDNDNVCSWPIDGELIKKCSKQQLCYLTPELYYQPADTTCQQSQNGKGNVIKITYNCMADEHKGL